MDDRDSDKQLGIYLNDHLAGATGGRDLARRAEANSTDPGRKQMWSKLAGEIVEDRATLVRIIDRLAIPENRFKSLLSQAAEKVGRLKLNGQIGGPSDLGQFLELEMLLLGVTGKLALWRMLDTMDDPRLRDFDFTQLANRANDQKQRLEEHRLELGARIFPGHAAGGSDSGS